MLIEYNGDPIPLGSRRKRQATSVNCTALETQLQQTKANIIQTEVRIRNATITYNTVINQLAIYGKKINVTSPKPSDVNLHNIYKKLLNSTTNTLTNLRNQQTTNEAEVTRIQNEINTYCKLSCGEYIKKILSELY